MIKKDINLLDEYTSYIPNNSGKHKVEKTEKMINHKKKVMEHQYSKKIWKNNRNIKRINPIFQDQLNSLYSIAEGNAFNDHLDKYGCYCDELTECDYGYYYRHGCKRRYINYYYFECTNCKNERENKEKLKEVSYEYILTMPWGIEKVTVKKLTW